MHTVTDYYDGPREGIADLGGAPHLYKAEWYAEQDNYADTFMLMPLDSETLALALEDWAIWKRWERAFHQGLADPESHPALPSDRERFEELLDLLGERLVIDPERSVRKLGEFRARADAEVTPIGVLKDLEVRWDDPS